MPLQIYYPEYLLFQIQKLNHEILFKKLIHLILIKKMRSVITLLSYVQAIMNEEEIFFLLLFFVLRF